MQLRQTGLPIAREILISKRCPKVGGRCEFANWHLQSSLAREARSSCEQDKKTLLRCNASRGRRNVTDAAIALTALRLSAAGYNVAAVLAALKRRSWREPGII
jgi:hypothetical protein